MVILGLMIWEYFILYFLAFLNFEFRERSLNLIYMHKLWFSNDERKLDSIFCVVGMSIEKM